jgi:plasmid stabilization system protein ParE
MTLRLIMTRRAERDLARVKAYIAQHNPAAAERVRQRIRQSIVLLCDYPYLGRPTARAEVLMTSVPRYRYKIYFTVVGDELRIIHIRHGSRRDPRGDEF